VSVLVLSVIIQTVFFLLWYFSNSIFAFLSMGLWPSYETVFQNGFAIVTLFGEIFAQASFLVIDSCNNASLAVAGLVPSFGSEYLLTLALYAFLQLIVGNFRSIRIYKYACFK